MSSWQTDASTTDSRSQHDAARPSRPTVHLTIASVDELPAAEAVIASLYGVQDGFGQLQHDQLIQALIIADMIDATEAAEQVSKCLKAAAASQPGLSEAALNILSGLSAWPDCLQQLLPNILRHINYSEQSSTAQPVASATANCSTEPRNVAQRLLLAIFGDLQAVWRDDNLKQLLLQLPLPAMQLLLGSNKLQVPTEDLVLFTAQKYILKQPDRTARANARVALETVIRAPHLSDVMLHYAAVSQDSHTLLTKNYLAQLRQLLLLRRSMDHLPGECMQRQLAAIPMTPSSWQLGRRSCIPAVPATAVWKVSLQELKEACVDACENGLSTVLDILDTPPMFGFPWSLIISCEAAEDGVEVDVAVGPKGLSPGFYITGHYVLESNIRRPQKKTICLESSQFDCWGDFLQIGPMPGGWDDSVWAAKGLSMTDELEITLKVTNVL